MFWYLLLVPHIYMILSRTFLFLCLVFTHIGVLLASMLNDRFLSRVVWFWSPSEQYGIHSGHAEKNLGIVSTLGDILGP